jgi:hypothetical protein
MFGVRQLEETREFGVRGLTLATGWAAPCFSWPAAAAGSHNIVLGIRGDEWQGLVALGFAAAV